MGSTVFYGDTFNQSATYVTISHLANMLFLTHFPAFNIPTITIYL